MATRNRNQRARAARRQRAEVRRPGDAVLYAGVFPEHGEPGGAWEVFTVSDGNLIVGNQVMLRPASTALIEDELRRVFRLRGWPERLVVDDERVRTACAALDASIPVAVQADIPSLRDIRETFWQYRAPKVRHSRAEMSPTGV